MADAAAKAPLERFEAAEPHMGTLVRITLYAPGKAEAAAAFERGFARIRELDNLLSDYKADSEVSRLSTTPKRASLDLYTVLQHAGQIAERTHGAFDVTCGPLTLLWREARRQHRLPDDVAIEAARQSTGFRKLRIKDGQVWFSQPGMRLDLGGIAKGYAADQALKACGVRRALVAVSGDIAIGAAPPGRKGWRVLLSATGETREISNAGVSTSGDSEQFLEVDGVRYSHILDPRTGRPVPHRPPVSVIARTAMQADASATAVYVTGVRRFPGVTVLSKPESA